MYLTGFAKPDPGMADYDPSAALAEAERRGEEDREHEEAQARLAEALAADKREALDRAPPETVQAYQDVYGRDPHGWPPDPDSPE